MDVARLLVTLRDLADTESDLCRAIRAQCQRSSSFSYETSVCAAERQKVIEILSEQPEFRGGRLKMWAEATPYPLYETELPDALIRRARGDGPEAAIQLLQDVLAVEEAEFFRVVPVWGLKIEEPTWIANDVCVAPAHAVPYSPPYRFYYQEDRGTSFMDHFFAILRPKTVLIARFLTRPFVIADGYVPPPPERKAAVARLNDARLCLSVVGPRTIVPSAHWEQFADHRLADIMMPALAYSDIEITPQRIEEANDPLDLKAAAEALSGLSGHHEKARVRLALDRFDKGMRRRTPGDMALEMAVAVEALLGGGGTELSYKVALRAALLRGGTRESRIETRSTIAALYALRSKVAHEGAVSETTKLPEIGKVDTAEFMSNAAKIVADVIRAALVRRSLPNWFEEEVGGQVG